MRLPGRTRHGHLTAAAPTYFLMYSLWLIARSETSPRVGATPQQKHKCNFAMRPLLALRGGRGESKRPGTVDYSIWDELSSESDRDPERIEPRVVRLAKPSDVTICGNNLEIDQKVFVLPASFAPSLRIRPFSLFS